MHGKPRIKLPLTEGAPLSTTKSDGMWKILAITGNHGYVLSPLPVAPVNETDMVLFPDGLKALKRVAKMTGLVLTGA